MTGNLTGTLWLSPVGNWERARWLYPCAYTCEFPRAPRLSGAQGISNNPSSAMLERVKLIGLIRPIWNGLGPVLEHGLGHAPLVVWGSGLVAAPALTTRLRDHPATVSWQPTLSNRHVSSPKEVAQLDGRRAAHWFMRSMIMCCLLASPGRPLRRICGA